MKKTKSILITRLRFMGDVTLTTPVVHVLREAYPKSRITYLAESPYADLLRRDPAIDVVLTLDRQSGKSALGSALSLVAGSFDVAIDLFGNPRSALLTALTGARMRIGGDFRGRRLAYSHRINTEGRNLTAVEHHLAFLEPLGLPRTDEPRDPALVVTRQEAETARASLEQRGFRLDRPLVGLHPGATWPAKRWMGERFAGVANRLAAEGVQVLFTMGPGEEDLLERIIKWCDFPVVPPRTCSLRELAATLRELDCFVSNDCGPMHIAPAVGTPTVGIFGPGWPEVWFPYRRELGHRLVYHALDCSGCDRDHCRKVDCMKSITVETVYGTVNEVLADNPRTRSL